MYLTGVSITCVIFLLKQVVRSHLGLRSSRLTQILQLLHLVILLPARIHQEFSDKILVLHKNTDSSNLNYLVKTSWDSSNYRALLKFPGRLLEDHASISHISGAAVPYR